MLTVGQILALLAFACSNHRKAPCY